MNDSPPASEDRVAASTGRRKLLRLAGSLIVLAVLIAALGWGLLRVLGTRERFSAYDLPYVQDFSDVDVSTWFTDGGVWSIRNKALAQVTNLDRPAHIFVPRTVPAEQFHHISTYVTISDKSKAAGIVFSAQYPELTQRLQRVFLRPATAPAGQDERLPQTLELVAGYTDDAGEFVPQVVVPFQGGAGQYRLDVYVLGNTYLVQLNGQTLIDKRPLFYDNGLIGLYALGPAVFDTLKVTAAEDDRPGEMVYVSDFDQALGGAGWVPFRGEWRLSQGELVQVDPSLQEAGIGYEGSAFESHLLQTSFRHLLGVGGGVLFNMPSPYQVNGAHVVRYSEQTGALFWGYYDDAGVFALQGHADVPAPGGDPVQLQVYSDDAAGSYDVHLDGKPLARGVPLQRRSGHIGLITSLSSVAYTTVEVFPLLGGAPASMLVVDGPAPAPAAASPASTPPTGTPSPAAPALPAATPLPQGSRAVVAGAAAVLPNAFAGDMRQSGWAPMRGRWRFVDGELRQEDATGFDQAITYVGSAFRNYGFETKLTHLEGSGAGLLFNMPFADRLDGAHMVRFSDRRPGGIFWGHFDESGKFVGQGYANVDPPGAQRHILRVVSGESTYAIYLDDAVLADGLPLRQNYGYVGLVTSQSSAAFADPQVDDGQSMAGGSTGLASGGAGVGAINGEWVVEDGVYRQTSPEATDYIYHLDIYAAEYTAQSTVVLPDLPAAGGGFIIHMPDRGQTGGAFLVRLIKGGEGVFWGTIDGAGNFVGRGSSELAKAVDGVYRLRLEVRGNRLGIFVNDQQMAADVLMPRSAGWIGLVAHSGPVTFGDVQIRVGNGSGPAQGQ